MAGEGYGSLAELAAQPPPSSVEMRPIDISVVGAAFRLAKGPPQGVLSSHFGFMLISD